MERLSTGIIITILIQSSSATVGMVIGLASQKMITLTGAIAVMLGSEIGTCADTLVASVGRSRAAVKTGLFHLLFNVATILLGMIFLPYFTQLVHFVSKGMPIQQTIANAHMLFNGLGVLIMLPFIGLSEKLLESIIPEKAGKPFVLERM